MRRLGLLTIVAAIGVATLVVGMGVRASSAVFGDQETTTATEATAACFANDAGAPTVDAMVMSKTVPYYGGYIRQGGAYYVYARVTPLSGSVSRVTADVRSISAGQYLVPLAAGSYSVGGVAYGYRSATLTAPSPLAAGTYSYSISVADDALRCRTATSTVVVDNTAPTGTDVQAENKTGAGPPGTVGRAEQSDTLTYTFSEVIDPETILAGWTGAATNVVVALQDSGVNDLIVVRNAANTVQLPLGSIQTGANLTTANVTFGATNNASTMTMSGSTITITLGNVSAGNVLLTDTANTTMIWTPSATPTDRAGNASTTTNVNESGAPSPEF